MLRNLPDSFDPQVVEQIDGRLQNIRVHDRVAIPLAIESGSRAWGFPSPDSDYDCRFIFVRPVDQLISPWTLRDVIETPLEGELDVNGWELGKALKLLLKGNAVVIEWLNSPILYGVDEGFRDEFIELARKVASPALVARHYLHLGVRQRRVYFADHLNVSQKKVFYALRPAAALRWLRLNPGKAVAPMDFPTLMAECEPPSAVRPVVADLLAKKAVTHELGAGPVPREILEFIDEEFERAGPWEPSDVIVPPEHREAANRFFREMSWRFNPGGKSYGDWDALSRWGRLTSQATFTPSSSAMRSR